MKIALAAVAMSLLAQDSMSLGDEWQCRFTASYQCTKADCKALNNPMYIRDIRPGIGKYIACDDPHDSAGCLPLEASYESYRDQIVGKLKGASGGFTLHRGGSMIETLPSTDGRVQINFGSCEKMTFIDVPAPTPKPPAR